MRSRAPKTAILWCGCVLALGPLAAMAQEAGGAAPPTYVGDETCAGCHEDVAAAMVHQIHQRVRDFEVRGHAVGCEGCHGPGSVHAEAGEIAAIRTFDEPDASQVCVDCHRAQGMARFKASVHAANGLACQDCHSIHQASWTPFDACADCHADVVAELQLPSHHPVREGKMTCASCHDVHGVGVALLAGDHQRINDACYDCHQKKEGPFVFEHAPVAESCSNCHSPHGAVADNLLALGEPSLCLQCHELHFHTGYESPEEEEVEIGGIRRENRFGGASMRIAFTTRCTQCHGAIHGTDSPSQTISGDGALTH